MSAIVAAGWAAWPGAEPGTIELSLQDVEQNRLTVTIPASGVQPMRKALREAYERLPIEEKEQQA